MAYPRQRRSLSEDDHSLTPPRPFFLASTTERNSWTSSSQDTSVEPSSDSDREVSPITSPLSSRARNRHSRRRSTLQESEAMLSQSLPASESGHGMSADTSVTSVPSSPLTTARAPPSSFAFPFQAYPGNPDPGFTIPGLGRGSRRSSSFESLPAFAQQQGHLTSSANPLTHTTGSLSDLHRSQPQHSIYGNSAAARVSTVYGTPTSPSFRAPFLSPASRPGSSLWSPPAYPQSLRPQNSTQSLPLINYKPKPPAPSTRLTAPLSKSEKPWLSSQEPRARAAWWITFSCLIVGLGFAAFICYRGVTGVRLLKPGQLCSVLDERFDGGDLDSNTWLKDVSLTGFGNGEFSMATSSSDNAFIRNGNLYIQPTLSSDSIENIFDGGKYTLPDCTDKDTSCTVSSSASRGTVINPIRSARINTKGKKSIRYGKVEVRAKLPKGDWLWPKISLVPEQDTYGPGLMSGEIDMLSARGNSLEYPGHGSNFVLSSLSYAASPPFPQTLPAPSSYISPVSNTYTPGLLRAMYGWYSMKRSGFDTGFHTYGMEWTEGWVRFYVDQKVKKVMELVYTQKDGGWFFNVAKFPETAQNGTERMVVENPWKSGSNAAPFDQSFYLVISLAAGGTSGWFPDGMGGKPWIDGSGTAMRDFTRAQDEWSKTWAADDNDRAFRIDSVKMWQQC